MDPESKELLHNTLVLTEENNKILHKIRGVQKREAIWKFFKLLLIVGLAFGSFYYLEPYLDKVMVMYNSVVGMGQDVRNATDSIKSATEVPNSLLQDLLDKF